MVLGPQAILKYSQDQNDPGLILRTDAMWGDGPKINECPYNVNIRTEKLRRISRLQKGLNFGNRKRSPSLRLSFAVPQCWKLTFSIKVTEEFLGHRCDENTGVKTSRCSSRVRNLDNRVLLSALKYLKLLNQHGLLSQRFCILAS